MPHLIELSFGGVVILALLLLRKELKWRQHRIAIVLLASAFVTFYVGANAGDSPIIEYVMLAIGLVFMGFSMRPLYLAIRSSVKGISRSI